METLSDHEQSEQEQSDQGPIPIIKHLIFSGGGVYGLSVFGALNHLYENKLWDINNIESIYGTSIGAIIGVVIALKYEWSILQNYLVNRPWDKIFKFDMYSVINSFQKKGLFDISEFEEIFKPLFGGHDIQLNVTMQEFFEITKIEIHIITTDLNTFESVDISYKTHPEWRVIDAVYASAALPILFSPLQKDSKYYIDGGILCNYPVKNCINIHSQQCEILGILRKHNIQLCKKMTDESSLLDFLFLLVNNLVRKLIQLNISNVENELRIPADELSLYNIYLFVCSIDERKRLIQVGIDSANEYIVNSVTLL